MARRRPRDAARAVASQPASEFTFDGWDLWERAPTIGSRPQGRCIDSNTDEPLAIRKFEGSAPPAAAAIIPARFLPSYVHDPED
jgi:hypothetical protein